MKSSANNIISFLGRFKLLPLLVLAVGLNGCYQGQTSKKPPIHINPNMDDQPKYQAQAESKFFANGQAMQKPIEGTIAFGHLREDVIFYTGKDAKGNLNASDVGVANSKFLANVSAVDTRNKSGFISSKIDYGVAKNAFLAGKAAYWLTGPWESDTLAKSGLKVKIVQIPKNY